MMETLEKIMKIIGMPIIYIILGVITYIIFKNIINNFFRLKKSTKMSDHKKNNTVRLLLLNILKYLIGGLVVLSMLPLVGIDIKSILAGLGILGLVIGLAFQDLIKDFLSGITIVIENQYALGDTIEIAGFKGEVVFLGLKTTKLKNINGAIKIIANRNIIDIINYSLNNSVAMVDVNVSYENDLDEVEKVLLKLTEKLTTILEKIVGKVNLLGITSILNSVVTYKITVETLPEANYNIERIIRKEVKLVLDKAKIKTPPIQLGVYNGK